MALSGQFWDGSAYVTDWPRLIRRVDLGLTRRRANSPTSGTDNKILYPQREDVNPVPRPDWVLTRRQEIGHHIAALRAARGLSVDDLADISGLDRKSVMRAEHAITSTGLDVLLQLARGLGIPLPDLVDAPEPPL